MTEQQHITPAPLAGLLGYAEREVARRAKGSHPGMVRLHDTELAALLALLRREVGGATAEAAPAPVREDAP